MQKKPDSFKSELNRTWLPEYTASKSSKAATPYGAEKADLIIGLDILQPGRLTGKRASTNILKKI